MWFPKIADMAMDLRLIDMDEATIHSYMNATLASAIDEYNGDSAFVSPSSGYYGLNPMHAGPKNLAGPKIAPISRSFRRAAFKILSERQTVLYHRDIAEIAMREGLIELTGTTIHRCMGAVLLDDIRQNGEKSAFVTSGPGWYGLNPNYVFPPAVPGSPARSTAHPTQPNPAKGALGVPVDYIGRGGEYLVASRLSFLGYVVHEPGMDKGIDLVATRDAKRYYNFQVKTSTTAGRKRQFHITKSTFEKTSMCNLFYVLVMLHPDGDGQHEDFFVIPHERIRDHIEASGLQGSNNKYLIKVVQDDEAFSLGGSDDITMYRNNWKIIK